MNSRLPFWRGEDPPPPDLPLRVIVVGPEKIMVVQVLLAIRSWTDAHCTAVCQRGTRYLKQSALVDQYLEFAFDGSEDGQLIDALNRLEAEQPGQVLVPADTKGCRLINRVRDRVAARCAPAASDAMLDVLDDKWQFHRLCRRLGLRTPASMYASSKLAIDFDAASARLGLPFIVKPLSEAQSHGACLIGSAEDFRRELLDNDDYRFAPLILQQFIRGHDVGVNLCAQGGRLRVLAMQRRDDPDDVASPIGFYYSPYLDKVARSICNATGYDGVMNIDARIEEGTGLTWLFEANPRYWRSLWAPTWVGMNFAAENLCGLPVPSVPRLLCEGTADAYHHPVLSPHLWRHALFGQGTQRRLARLMASDICTLMNSLRIAVERTRALLRS